ncbi:hypothetical protein BDD12DRAFT_898243 [Trichophaea hybrida]|nr:hypothetical protein BDD12DRAFT_898243 [Trichophaea hybrida]
MFLTVPTELTVWRKQASLNIVEEFTSRPPPPTRIFAPPGPGTDTTPTPPQTQWGDDEGDDDASTSWSSNFDGEYRPSVIPARLFTYVERNTCKSTRHRQPIGTKPTKRHDGGGAKSKI